MEEQQAEQRKSIPWFWWTAAGLMLLVAYPLSMGPVGWLFEVCELDGDHWAYDVADLVYWPIGNLEKMSPALRALADQYLALWLTDR